MQVVQGVPWPSTLWVAARLALACFSRNSLALLDTRLFCSSVSGRAEGGECMAPWPCCSCCHDVRLCKSLREDATSSLAAGSRISPPTTPRYIEHCYNRLSPCPARAHTPSIFKKEHLDHRRRRERREPQLSQKPEAPAQEPTGLLATHTIGITSSEAVFCLTNKGEWELHWAIIVGIGYEKPGSERRYGSCYHLLSSVRGSRAG